MDVVVPQPGERLVNPNGYVTSFWYRLFNDLARSVNGIDDQIAADGLFRVDGLQVLWGDLAAITSGTGSGGVFFGNGSAVTFAEEFVEAPWVGFTVVPTNGLFSVTCSALSATGFTPRVWGSTNTSATATGSKWLAVGRWR